jgi:hypothetical protein
VTIDGVVSATEWNDTQKEALSFCSGAVTGSIRMKNDATNLYVAAQIDNATWLPGTSPLVSTEQQVKITAAAAGAAPGASFAARASISGDTMLIGAPDDDGIAPGTGAAYVFVRVAGTWQLQKKLLAFDGVAGDAFGGSVALQNDHAVVAAPSADVNGTPNAGAAYAFVRSGNTWTLEDKLVQPSPFPNAGFGPSHLDGTTMIVGAGNFAQVGEVLIYNEIGGHWIARQTIDPPAGAAGDGFGQVAVVSGDVALIDSPGRDDFGPDSGAAYVYAQDQLGRWVFVDVIHAPDARAGDRFSTRVRLTPNEAIITAPLGFGVAPTSGAVYAYDRTGPGMTFRQKIIGPGGSDGGGFGTGLGSDGALMAVGAPNDVGPLVSPSGAVYLFEKQTPDWQFVQKILPLDPVVGDNFGFRVGVSGDTVAVVANLNAGAAYAFVAPSTTPPFTPQPGTAALGLLFDDGAGHGQAAGDNSWLIRASDSFALDGLNPDGALGHVTPDVVLGGSSDVTAAITHTNPVPGGKGTYFVEFRAPLASGDRRDFALTLGQQLGLTLRLDTGDCAGTDAMWVAPTPSGLDAPAVIADSIGLPCAGFLDCANGFCVDGVCCTSACGGSDPTDCQACSLLAGAQFEGTCGPLRASQVCRPSAGACDVAESCDGTSVACPADVVVPAATTCRPSAGLCDVAETCDGAHAACPADVVAPAATPCRPSTGACDVAETCDGAHAACPADVMAPAATPCRPSAGACDVAESCDGAHPVCPADVVAPAATPCRPSAGACDVAESCDGTSAACPSDVVAPAATPCRPSAGACDVAESCDGTSAACPADVVAPAATPCRPSAGACDVAESCDGTSAACPADVVAPAATPCRPSAGACDVAESCDGARAACPPDRFVAAGTVCHARTAACDSIVSCSGSDASCVVPPLPPPEICSPVPPGSPVVNLENGDTVVGGLTLSYDNVTSSGGTIQIAQPQAGLPPPTPNFKIVTDTGTLGAFIWDLVDTASFTGNVTICVKYPTADRPLAPYMTFVHYSATHTCQDVHGVTTNWCPLAPSTMTNPSQNIICGVTDSFSPFALWEPVSAPPALTVPAPIVVEATGPAGAAVTYAATATDAVDGALTPSCAPSAGSTFPLGVTTVSCQVTDSLGLGATGSFTITVQDTTGPSLSGVPAAPIVAYATSTAGAKVTYPSPTANDLVEGSRPVNCTPASNTTFAPGKTTVSCSASDTRGNARPPSTFTVWVQYQAPTDGTFFLAPIRPNGSSIFAIGRPVPVRFRLTGASAAITNLAAKLVVTKISSAIQGTTTDTSDETDDDTGFAFLYRPVLHWYAYRWKTRDQTQGTYQLRADLGDGVTHQVNVSLKSGR